MSPRRRRRPADEPAGETPDDEVEGADDEVDAVYDQADAVDDQADAVDDQADRADELDAEADVEADDAGLDGAGADDAGLEEELDGAVGERKRPNAFVRLYRGQTHFDFIGNRKKWFTISAIIIVAGIISLGTRGLNLGIDFKGGQTWQVQSSTLTVPQATAAVEAAGIPQPTVLELTDQIHHTKTIEVEADLNSKTQQERLAIENQVTDALGKAAGIPASQAAQKISFNDVGPTWGGQVTSKAIEALIVFFIAVVIFISIRFEFKMAIAALVAVIHDILVTVGIYSLAGFQVSPDTVIAILTVLGYSLYDTVVVFDRIAENAKGLGATGRITYSETVNLSMNQTLARSINTSMVAIIPVLSVLVVGSVILGATSLEDFGLALVIGLTSGAYSSIFIASPLLAMMKEREPRYVTIRQRLEARGDRMGNLTPSSVAAMSMAGAARGGGRARPQSSGVIRPGASRGAGRQPAATGAVRPGASKGAPAAKAPGARTPSS
ncbi:MAG TPA: protein translocase subunit SecF, partial [Acidimicrobiales bacterium]|nr:protein translocase subunit SecF [Acidimicrobiales bacterium]